MLIGADVKDVVHQAAWRRALATRLLAWFSSSARDLPWRRTRDLYAIWISEVMLQQTQVATVIPYWQRFLARFPAVSDLAAADEQEVLRLWEGLGYYRRARQLHAAAQAIAGQHGGEFPRSYDAVRALPGIGRYTAGAILSIGLDQRLPILEANTIRVLSRLIGFEGDPATTAGQKHLWAIAEAILPREQCGAFNQALMELGSEVCTPRDADCSHCPVRALCVARRDDAVARIPLQAKRTNYEDRTEIAIVVQQGNHVLVRQCQPGERWAGLWDFPRFATETAANISEQIATHLREVAGLATTEAILLSTMKHGVTRFRITLHCYRALVRGRRRASANGSTPLQWVLPAELADLPLSTTGRNIAGILSGGTASKHPQRSVKGAPQTAPVAAALPRRSRRKPG